MYVINMHTYGGSQAEASWPQATVTVETAADVKEVEDAFKAHVKRFRWAEAALVVTEVLTPLSGADAAAQMVGEFDEYFDPEGEEEDDE